MNVGDATVSVYVEDTSRRIMEANRWMAGLGLRSRYRLRSRLSNMFVQVSCQHLISLEEEGQGCRGRTVGSARQAGDWQMQCKGSSCLQAAACAHADGHLS